MKNKNTAGVLLLCVGVVLALCSLPGLLQTYVVGDSAMLSALSEENALFALLMSHAPETAGLGAVFLLLGLLLLVKLPGPREEAEAAEKPEAAEETNEARNPEEAYIAKKPRNPEKTYNANKLRNPEEAYNVNKPRNPEETYEVYRARKPENTASNMGNSHREVEQTRRWSQPQAVEYSSQWIQPRKQSQPQARSQSEPQSQQSQSQPHSYPWQDSSRSDGEEASLASTDHSPKEYRISFSETE